MMELASSLSYEAISIATSEGRSRVEGADLLDALRGYGFENYIKPIDMYMDAYHIHADTCQVCKGPSSSTAEAGVTTRTLPKKDWGAKEPIARRVAPPKAKKPSASAIKVDWNNPSYVARVQKTQLPRMTEALSHPNPDFVLATLANETKVPISQVRVMFQE